MQVSDLIKLKAQGRSLTTSEAELVRSCVQEDPFDLPSRIKLLGYFKSQPDKFRKEEIEQIIWIIDHVCDQEIAFLSMFMVREADRSEVTEHWLRQVESPNVTVATLLNASYYFEANGEKSFHERVLLEAAEVDSQNVRVLLRLADLYKSNAIEDSSAVSKAISCCEKVISLGRGDDSELEARGKLASLAFLAGLWFQAERAATDLLESVKKCTTDQDFGWAIHSAHTVLGNIAMKNDDTQKALSHLDQSTAFDTSAIFELVGPDMSLAKALLLDGHNEAVIHFLERCGRRITQPEHQKILQNWKQLYLPQSK